MAESRIFVTSEASGLLYVFNWPKLDNQSKRDFYFLRFMLRCVTLIHHLELSTV
jgi:hypothetical protein